MERRNNKSENRGEKVCRERKNGSYFLFCTMIATVMFKFL